MSTSCQVLIEAKEKEIVENISAGISLFLWPIFSWMSFTLFVQGIASLIQGVVAILLGFILAVAWPFSLFVLTIIYILERVFS